MAMTLAQFRHSGGYTAFVPGDVTHVITRSREISKHLAPTKDWPNGRTITHSGPETLPVEVTAEGFRVVRFRTPQDFHDLVKGRDGLAWQKINSELRQRIAAESNNHAGPIR